MILLGIILLVIGIFVARNILWPIGAVVLIIGLILLFANRGSYTYY